MGLTSGSVNIDGVGNWYDNAPTESFFGTLKSESVHHRGHRTRKVATTDLLFTDAFYE